MADSDDALTRYLEEEKKKLLGATVTGVVFNQVPEPDVAGESSNVEGNSADSFVVVADKSPALVDQPPVYDTVVSSQSGAPVTNAAVATTVSTEPIVLTSAVPDVGLDGLERRLANMMEGLSTQLGKMEERMSRVEGLLLRSLAKIEEPQTNIAQPAHTHINTQAQQELPPPIYRAPTVPSIPTPNVQVGIPVAHSVPTTTSTPVQTGIPIEAQPGVRLAFDERLINDLMQFGYEREKIIQALTSLHERNKPTNNINEAIDEIEQL